MIFMGEKIRELRTEKKMTQEQLANRLAPTDGTMTPLIVLQKNCTTATEKQKPNRQWSYSRTT